MKIALRSDGPVRRWHVRLRDRLAAAGHTLVVLGTDTRAPSASPAIVLACERLLYGASASLFANLGASSKDGDADLVLEARFDGAAGERGLIAALLARRAPLVEIADSAARVLAAGLPAVEKPDVLACGLDHVLARTEQLVAEAVRAVVGARASCDVSEPLTGGTSTSAPAFLAKTLVSKLRARRRSGDARLPSWRIAVRPAGHPGVALGRKWDGAPFHSFVHDGRRFQADPFVLEHAGRICLFFEDFPFATRRGVIAMQELQADGGWSLPRVVLEEPFHLSYPHVFVWDKTVYMLPEASAGRCIRLYRGDPFPDRFVPDRVLVEGVESGDATLVAHAGSWWLFATLAGDGGSTWDALGLFVAPHPFGPWAPHPANPVLIDAGAARPAGEMWHEDGVLMRVAQDCRDGYGKGLAICRVDRLDAEGYAQTVVARLSSPSGQSAQGVHTLNRGGGFELIDLV